MNKMIQKVEINGEKVYLKKDFLGWRTVEPIIDNVGNPVERKHLINKLKSKEVSFKNNWMQFISGGKRGLVILITLLVLLGIIYLGVREQIDNYRIIAKNPCQFCKDNFAYKGATQVPNTIFNLSGGENDAGGT